MRTWIFIIIAAVVGAFVIPPLTPRGRRQSALIRAIYSGDMERIESILTEKFDLNFVHRRFSPLCLAVARNNRAMVELFLKHGASPKAPGNESLLVNAARSGNHEYIDLALAAGHDIHFRPHHQPTPLEAATYYSRTETVKYLIAKGASKNDLRNCSWYPIRADTIQVLLDFGVEVPPDVADAVRKGEWR